MILPNKNLDLNYSPLSFSAKLLSDYSGKEVSFETIRNIGQDLYGEKYWIVVSRSLNFLYLAGKIQYEIKTDRIIF